MNDRETAIQGCYTGIGWDGERVSPEATHDLAVRAGFHAGEKFAREQAIEECAKVAKNFDMEMPDPGDYGQPCGCDERECFSCQIAKAIRKLKEGK